MKVSDVDQEYHNSTQQTNPWHREEKPQNINSNKTSERQLKQSKQLFLPHPMIAKLERTQRNEYQKKDQHRTTTQTERVSGYMKQ